MMFVIKYFLFLYYSYVVQSFLRYVSKFECDLYFNKKGHDYLSHTDSRFTICIRKNEIKKTYVLETNISKQMIIKLDSKFWLVFYTNECNCINQVYNLKIFYFKNFPALKYHFILNKTDFEIVSNEFFNIKNKYANNTQINYYLNNDEN